MAKSKHQVISTNHTLTSWCPRWLLNKAVSLRWKKPARNICCGKHDWSNSFKSDEPTTNTYLEPKCGPLFWGSSALFWGVDLQKNRGHWGSRYIYSEFLQRVCSSFFLAFETFTRDHSPRLLLDSPLSQYPCTTPWEQTVWPLRAGVVNKNKRWKKVSE